MAIPIRIIPALSRAESSLSSLLRPKAKPQVLSYVHIYSHFLNSLDCGRGIRRECPAIINPAVNPKPKERAASIRWIFDEFHHSIRSAKNTEVFAHFLYSSEQVVSRVLGRKIVINSHVVKSLLDGNATFESAICFGKAGSHCELFQNFPVSRPPNSEISMLKSKFNSVIDMDFPFDSPNQVINVGRANCNCSRVIIYGVIQVSLTKINPTRVLGQHLGFQIFGDLPCLESRDFRTSKVGLLKTIGLINKDRNVPEVIDGERSRGNREILMGHCCPTSSSYHYRFNCQSTRNNRPHIGNLDVHHVHPIYGTIQAFSERGYIVMFVIDYCICQFNLFIS